MGKINILSWTCVHAAVIRYLWSRIHGVLDEYMYVRPDVGNRNFDPGVKASTSVFESLRPRSLVLRKSNNVAHIPVVTNSEKS